MAHPLVRSVRIRSFLSVATARGVHSAAGPLCVCTDLSRAARTTSSASHALLADHRSDATAPLTSSVDALNRPSRRAARTGAPDDDRAIIETALAFIPRVLAVARTPAPRSIAAVMAVSRRALASALCRLASRRCPAASKTAVTASAALRRREYGPPLPGRGARVLRAASEAAARVINEASAISSSLAPARTASAIARSRWSSRSRSFDRAARCASTPATASLIAELSASSTDALGLMDKTVSRRRPQKPPRAHPKRVGCEPATTNLRHTRGRGPTHDPQARLPRSPPPCPREDNDGGPFLARDRPRRSLATLGDPGTPGACLRPSLRGARDRRSRRVRSLGRGDRPREPRTRCGPTSRDEWHATQALSRHEEKPEARIVGIPVACVPRSLVASIPGEACERSYP